MSSAVPTFIFGLISVTLLTPAAFAADLSAMNSRLETVIAQEMRDWDIRGISVALVDDQKIVYAAGFGEAKRDSIFRVGSISKLFNAVAVLQQVEAGKLDLDAPLPAELLPINPFPGEPAVTLRQILCHRSGLQRESTVGGYFDDSQPGLAATVASVPPCVLVTRPGEKTRYSNLAPSLAGHRVEQMTGQRFQDYQHTRVLGPLGMTNSAWTIAELNRDRVVPSHMRVADGHGAWTHRDAPLFDLGTLPAGNLFSTVEDLARFGSALIAGGAPVLKHETLNEMWRPQLTTETTGFGLGFMVGKFRNHRTIGHNGAVYGCSSSFVVLPEEKLAAVVLGNEDIVNGRIHHISDAALSLLLETKFGEKPPAAPEPYTPADLRAFAGDYESQSYWANLRIEKNALVADISGQPTRFTATGELKFTAASNLEDDTPVEFEREASGGIVGFKLGVQHFTRVPAKVASLPAAWRSFLGSYGPDFIPFVVSERHGHLYAMTENMVDYRLTPVNRNVCSFPLGMYTDEQSVFMTRPDGTPEAVNFANMWLKRR